MIMTTDNVLPYLIKHIMLYSLDSPRRGNFNEPQHDKTNKMTCTQRRLRLAWASAQSDQCLCYPPEDTLDPILPTECTAKTLIRLGDAQAILSLRWAHR